MKTNCSCLDLSEPATCAACVYGVCWGCSYPNAIQCRRHAPTANVAEHSRAVWPDVQRHGWCGDFVSRETDADLRAKLAEAHERASQFAVALNMEQEKHRADE